jgi:hypothetical protein
MSLYCTTIFDGKIVTKELAGIDVHISRNGSFIEIEWRDDKNNCQFRIVESQLKEFLNKDNPEHGERQTVYGEYWK